MCLHREIGARFTAEEREYARRLGPHIAEAIRTSLLVTSLELPQIADAPGLVVLGPGATVVSTTAAGERWLEELGWPLSERNGRPAELQALAAVVDQPHDTEREPPRVRMRTLAGRWVVLHASRLTTEPAATVAVIIEEATPADLAPILMMAYGLTNKERTLTSLVCRGLSTSEIAERLHITPNTIQDHLKSIFDKTDVRSRRELAMSLLQHQYVPRTMAGTPIGPSGFFVE